LKTQGSRFTHQYGSYGRLTSGGPANYPNDDKGNTITKNVGIDPGTCEHDYRNLMVEPVKRRLPKGSNTIEPFRE